MSEFNQKKSGKPRTRFAPSPTGCLHLGHVASAIFVWGVAKVLNAEIILRIEDHDQTRSKKTYEEAILKDLEWLGFIADEGVSSAHVKSPYRQSDHNESYIAALNNLIKQDLVFGCECSRKQVAAQMVALGEVDFGELFYAGHCRGKNLSLSKPNGVRFRIDEATKITFNDLFLGEQVQTPKEQCGDLLIKDRHGFWTYQFAVTVDDMNENIDLIVRGQDLVAASGRQIILANKLSRVTPPRFYHHPLILAGDGQKLSKRQLAEPISKSRAEGASPDGVLKQAAQAVGFKIPARGSVNLSYFADQISLQLGKNGEY